MLVSLFRVLPFSVGTRFGTSDKTRKCVANFADLAFNEDGSLERYHQTGIIGQGRKNDISVIIILYCFVSFTGCIVLAASELFNVYGNTSLHTCHMRTLRKYYVTRAWCHTLVLTSWKVTLELNIANVSSYRFCVVTSACKDTCHKNAH